MSVGLSLVGSGDCVSQQSVTVEIPSQRVGPVSSTAKETAFESTEAERCYVDDQIIAGIKVSNTEQGQVK